MINSDIYQWVEVNLNPQDIHISESAVLKLLGYDNQEPEEHILHAVQSAISRSYGLLKPKGWITAIPVVALDGKAGILELQGVTFRVNKIIASQLKNVEAIVLFVCTIGDALETLSRDCFGAGDLLEGYLFDLIGSEAADGVAEYIHQEVSIWAGMKHFGITNRFSPGYCQWNVAEQFHLFKMFPPGFSDVQLTDSALMNPVKSVSGIIGMGKRAQFKEYACRLCGQENCIYRNRS